ncbi:hypothetical protein KEM60_02039 [Austwickia sp. TVS 96-490-7B]|uniref:YecA family protein n=1 Tax=Austwickia sp. TVS 96-490-7B TaxID=2830843 RepID=UPI001C569D69|nr:SEC-C domain-containing protein [Austwickia sp. TVS 96-490-7B]MBW3085828.1 hypothetical protein [Austwickia sp. TVS 96-490-7B]
MANTMVHIGTVVENSLGWSRSIWDIPGKEIWEFGDRVREWAAAFDYADVIRSQATYYGGWPSANLATVGWEGGVVSSALLFEDHILGKDSISDWFSDEQYQREKLLVARMGWRRDDNRPALSETRAFLAVQLPRLRRLLPLLDAGVIKLAPSEKLLWQSRDDVKRVAKLVSGAALTNAQEITKKFGAQELPIDDDVRGLFQFAGGGNDWDMARLYLNRAATHFAREYVLASSLNGVYSSVFDFEEYLLRYGLGASVASQIPVVEALLSSRMPMFSNVNPKLLARIHGSDDFEEFRADLAKIYVGIPTRASKAEVQAYIDDREKTLLRPIVKRAVQDVDRGFLGKLGVGLKPTMWGLIGGITGALVSGSVTTLGALAGAAVPLLGTAIDSAIKERPQGSRRVWMRLVQHSRSVEQEILYTSQPPSDPPDDTTGRPWGLPLASPLSLQVTPGLLLMWREQPSTGANAGGYSGGAYAPCPCGSTLKYKFCCSRVPGATAP